MVGTDWIAIARWITIAYASLQILGIFAVGLLLPTITVPVQDPNTGQIVDQTFNIRPFLALVAFVAIIFYAIIVWLTKYGIARGIVLAVVVLSAIGALSRLGAETSAAVGGTIVLLLCDAGYAYVLVMSFVSRPHHAPLGTGGAQVIPVAAAPPPPPPPAPPPLLPLPPQ
jgi:hypothetical protein